MPEGHVIHRLAGDLDAAFGGRRVRASSPQGRFDDGARLIDGARFRGAEAFGKHLLVELGRGRARTVLHVHLGLYGSWSVDPVPRGRTAPAPVGQVRLRLESVGWVADLRGPTMCELLDPLEQQRLLDRLGPDPLRADARERDAWDVVSRSASPIALLLMRQDVVAGVGNVYRAEVLFRRGIDPMTPGRALGRREWLGVWRDLVRLMAAGVGTGSIDTVRTRHLPERSGRAPREDRHGGEVYVYRRASMPCLECGTPVAQAELAGRNLFWCPTCQPASGGLSPHP